LINIVAIGKTTVQSTTNKPSQQSATLSAGFNS